ncbi:MAG: type II secretion system protein GspG [Phycisphaerales bacterium]
MARGNRIFGLVSWLALVGGVWAPGALAQQDAAPQAQTPQAAPESDAESKYIRVTDSDDGAHLKLDVAVRTLSKPGAPDVQLVGVVHIGDQAYYDELQKFLDAQSLVLFEGVKPSGSGAAAPGDDAAKVKTTTQRQRLLAVLISRYRADKNALPATFEDVLAPLHGSIARLGKAATTDAWGHLQQLKLDAATPTKFDIVSLGSDGQPGGDGAAADILFSAQAPLTDKEQEGAGEGIQTKLARAMGLKFQLAAIDYTHPTWRNSDLSIDEVEKKLEESGASGDALFKMLDGSSFASKVLGFMLGFVEHNQELSLTVKVMMVEVLAHADDMMSMAGKQAKGMDTLMKVIVQDRNQEVLKDLAAASQETPAPRSIALFYGAGHLPDLEKHLTDDGYTYANTQWFTAIDADLNSVPGMKAQAAQIRKMIKAQMARQRSAK